MQKSLFRHDLSALCCFIHQWNMPILLLCRLYTLQAKHNPNVSARRTLNLASVLRLSVDCKMQRDAMVDPVDSLSIPTRYWFINANSLGRRNGWRAIFVEIGHKTSTSFQQYCSAVISAGRNDGWSLKRMHCQRSSMRFRERFVLPNNGAGMYFEVAAVVAQQRLRR